MCCARPSKLSILTSGSKRRILQSPVAAKLTYLCNRAWIYESFKSSTFLFWPGEAIPNSHVSHTETRPLQANWPQAASKQLYLCLSTPKISSKTLKHAVSAQDAEFKDRAVITVMITDMKELTSRR